MESTGDGYGMASGTAQTLDTVVSVEPAVEEEDEESLGEVLVYKAPFASSVSTSRVSAIDSSGVGEAGDGGGHGRGG